MHFLGKKTQELFSLWEVVLLHSTTKDLVILKVLFSEVYRIGGICFNLQEKLGKVKYLDSAF